METLASVASLSPYYFQRLFGSLVKKSVNEYVRLRRLAKASEALKSKEKRIIDVVLDYGFSDHANFTRAFKDAYGITPDEYRVCPVILNHFINPDLLLKYIMVDEDVQLIADGIVVEMTRRKLDEPRTFIGIDGEVPDTELECLCKHVEIEYQSRPILEYSKCSMQHGWNVKYKKAGRTLCTIYPMEGYFIALIVIGNREQTETELTLPLFTEYFRQVYHETKTGMGQKWLMINVKDAAVLEDVKQCIAIRRGKKKN